MTVPFPLFSIPVRLLLTKTVEEKTGTGIL